MSSLHKTWLVCILFMAVGLRLYGITERGLFQSDEGYYLGAARTQRVALDWGVKHILGISQPGLSEAALEKGGTVPSAAKPGFLALIVFSSFFIGMHDYSGLIVSGIAGTLTVFVVFLIGRRLWDTVTGLTAATILSVLNYHVVFSRAGISAAVSVLFVCLGILWYLHSLKASSGVNLYLFAAGVSIGYAFTCHYNLFYIPLVFLSFEVIYSFKAAWSLRIQGKRLLILSSAMVFPLMIFEVIYASTKVFLYSRGFGSILEKTVWGKFYTYFEQVIHQISMSGHFGINDPYFYIKLLLRNDGYLYIGLLIFGVIFFILQLRKIRFENYLILFLFFSPVLFWSLCCLFQVERLFLITSAMSALIVSFSLNKLVGQKKQIIIAIVLLIFVNGMCYCLPTLRAKSGYIEAIAYMKERKGVKCFSTMPTITRNYIGINNVHNLQKKSREKIEELYKQGFDYLLLDQDKHVYSDTLFIQGAKLVSPVFEIAHPTDIFLYEGFTPQIRKNILSEAKVLRVYDMGAILKATE